jgi:hypothetical protein
MKKVKLFGEISKSNEDSFTMIEFYKLFHDEYRSKNFDHENELKEKIKNQF